MDEASGFEVLGVLVQPAPIPNFWRGSEDGFSIVVQYRPWRRLPWSAELHLGSVQELLSRRVAIGEGATREEAERLLHERLGGAVRRLAS